MNNSIHGPLLILYLEDNLYDRDLAAVALARDGLACDFIYAGSQVEFEQALQRPGYDLIFSDFTLPSYNGLAALEIAQRIRPEVPFLFVSGTMGEERAVASLKSGATDYVLKNHLEQLAPAVRRAMRETGLRRARQEAEEASRERGRLAELTAEVARALVEKRELRESLRLSCQALVNKLDAAFARIWTLNAEEQVLELQASAGLYIHLDGSHARVAVGHFKVGLIARERKPHLTNEVQMDPQIADKEWAKEAGIVAFAGYPLLIEDRLVGVMAIFACQPLTEFALKGLASVADGLALGIERKRAEEELRNTHDNLRHFLAHTPAVIYTLKLEETKVTPLFMTENVQRLLGFSVAEATACNWWLEALHPDDRDRALAQATAGLRENGCSLEYRLRHKDGTYRWIEDNNRLVRDADGRAVEAVGVWTDITERKRLESEVVLRDQQLRQAQKMEAVGQLAGGVAHDFNNMLAVIRLNSELLLMDPDSLSAEAKDGLTQIAGATDRAANLTRQLLTFSRKQVLKPQSLMLNEVIKNLMKMLDRIIGEDIDLRCHFDQNLPFVFADTGMMEQVILNLVVNSRDAMHRGGTLHLTTESTEVDQGSASRNPEARPGHFVCLTVRDTGTGISPEDLPRIFEPFFTTKRPGKGTGLGLATVYGIVKQHQGWIEVFSRDGEGTSFKIFLPVIASPASTDCSTQSLAGWRGGTETILLVEDEASVRAITRRVLEKAQYNVCEAACAQEAREIWEQRAGKIDLLITDIVLPRGVTGRDLAQGLRELEPSLKCVFMSGYSGEVAGQETELFYPSSRFLQKPCPPGTLLETVRQCLDGLADPASGKVMPV